MFPVYREGGNLGTGAVTDVTHFREVVAYSALTTVSNSSRQTRVKMML